MSQASFFRGCSTAASVKIILCRRHFANKLVIDLIQFEVTGKMLLSNAIAGSVAVRLRKDINPMYDQTNARVLMFARFLRYALLLNGKDQLENFADSLQRTIEALELSNPDLSLYVQSETIPFFRTEWRLSEPNEFHLLSGLQWSRVYCFERIFDSFGNTPIYLTKEYAETVLTELRSTNLLNTQAECVAQAIIVCTKRNADLSLLTQEILDSL